MAEETVVGTMEEKETTVVGGWVESRGLQVQSSWGRNGVQTCGCGEQEGTKGGGRAG